MEQSNGTGREQLDAAKRHNELLGHLERVPEAIMTGQTRLRPLLDELKNAMEAHQEAIKALEPTQTKNLGDLSQRLQALELAVSHHQGAVMGWKQALLADVKALRETQTAGQRTRQILWWLSGMLSGVVVASILVVLLGPLVRVVTVSSPVAPAASSAGPQRPGKGR